MRFKCRGSDGLNTWTKMCLRGVFERKQNGENKTTFAILIKVFTNLDKMKTGGN